MLKSAVQVIFHLAVASVIGMRALRIVPFCIPHATGTFQPGQLPLSLGCEIDLRFDFTVADAWPFFFPQAFCTIGR